MVRQYRIHTDLDGSENKIYDMTNGLIRFYQPSDLGLVIGTNIWQSQGIGVMGNNNISHPDIDFKFETFGNSLEENYRIFNEFINSIIKQKYITLEYTNEIGTYYADIQLSKITKTEGYGFDGQFSETISFIPVNMWYVYEQLKFSKVQNGEIGGNTKIYGNKETTVYPNLNLLTDTKDFKNKNVAESQAVTSITSPYSVVMTENDTTFLRFSRVDGGVQDWFRAYLSRGVVSANFPNITIKGNTRYTFSVYLRGTGTHTLIAYDSWTNPINVGQSVTLTSDWKLYTFTALSRPTADLPVDKTVQFFIRSGTAGTVIDVKKPKVEEGSVATPWMQSESEVTISDYRNYGSYKYDYTYFGEDNIERFSKWKIDDGIFSFTARVIPSAVPTTEPTPNGRNDYGIRFLDKDFNEYTAIMFNDAMKPESIQFNTDVNDEYYQAQIGTTTVNVFSALNYQRFRTRLIQKGTMELINVDMVEMNVKRKVEFV